MRLLRFGRHMELAPVRSGRDAYHAHEELAEVGGILVAHITRNIVDCLSRLLQELLGPVEPQLLDIADRGVCSPWLS